MLGFLIFIFLFSSKFLNEQVSADTKFSQIVNGNEAKEKSFPYMVAIKTTIKDLHVLCGGTLIHSQLVLTAAKCLDGASEAEVILGIHNLTKPIETLQKFTVTKEAFIIHEYYNSTHIRHDIAVIFLKTPVKLNDYVKITKIPQMDDIMKTYDELSGVIVGWGKTSDIANQVNDTLYYAEVVIIPLISCQIIHILEPLNLDQMCTSGTAKVNICLGDNGGPLMVDDVQVGIASFGNDVGCEIGFPGVYTRLSSYLQWLNNSLAELPLKESFKIY